MIGGGIGIGMVSTSFPPGAPNNNKGPDFPDQIYKCTFTNFGPQPVVNVEATFTVTFRSVVWRPDGMGSSSGVSIRTVPAASPRVSLGTGLQNRYSFFIRNSGSDFVDVVLPKTVRAQAIGTDNWQTATLIPPRLGGFNLQPFFRGLTTDLLSVFMADLARDEPSALLHSVKLENGFMPLISVVKREEIKSGFAYFFVPKSAGMRQFELLAPEWDRHVPLDGLKRVIFYYESDFANREKNLTTLANREGLVVEFRGQKYLAAVIAAMRMAARKPPPHYEIKEGLPILAQPKTP